MGLDGYNKEWLDSLEKMGCRVRGSFLGGKAPLRNVASTAKRDLSLKKRVVLHGFEAEEARHADHGGAAVEELLLLGEGPDGVGDGVGGEGLEGRGDEQSGGQKHGGGSFGELLHHGFAGGDLGTGGGDEGEHGEAAVHELGAGGDEVGAFGAVERERLLQGEAGGLHGSGRHHGFFGGVYDGGDGLFSRADDGRAARGAGSLWGGHAGGEGGGDGEGGHGVVDDVREVVNIE